ncbi:MAG: hypothetical protein V8T48_12645 [Oscillospiraceae bacterium]
MKLLTVTQPCYPSQDDMGEVHPRAPCLGETGWRSTMIDDGSKDNTGKIADEYALQIPGHCAGHSSGKRWYMARASIRD